KAARSARARVPALRAERRRPGRCRARRRVRPVAAARPARAEKAARLMKTIFRIAAALALLAAGAVLGAEPDLPPPYVPPPAPVTGHITLWGHGALAGRFDFIEALVKEWEKGFNAFHPGVQFENRLTGTASAMGALYTGTGDLAL